MKVSCNAEIRYVYDFYERKVVKEQKTKVYMIELCQTILEIIFAGV